MVGGMVTAALLSLFVILRTVYLTVGQLENGTNNGPRVPCTHRKGHRGPSADFTAPVFGGNRRKKDRQPPCDGDAAHGLDIKPPACLR